MPIQWGWKLLDLLDFVASLKPLERLCPAMCLLRLMQAARRVVGLAALS